MKKILLILAIVSFVACSKLHSPPGHFGHSNEVTWRFVVYDSNSRVVDSTLEVHYPDSAIVPVLGPVVYSTISLEGNIDTAKWLPAASFFISIGPSVVLPGIANIPVPSGGCAFRSSYLWPSLDRTGWMLQRTQNGKRINMFSTIINNNGYDGKFNDFPYPLFIGGIRYPNMAQQDYSNLYWICDSTQGSCRMGPQF